ncbi:MAG: mannonate dehydratase, partial [Gemmatimonadota bacterium]|nr:mannonate dehydratase [Gemmatimonadota bacterium]
MIKIAEVLPDHPTPLWRMVKQCGVDHVVGGFSTPGDPADIHPEQRPWSFTNLVRMKTAFND